MKKLNHVIFMNTAYMVILAEPFIPKLIEDAGFSWIKSLVGKVTKSFGMNDIPII